MGADVGTATDRTGWAMAEKEGLGGGVMVIVGWSERLTDVRTLGGPIRFHRLLEHPKADGEVTFCGYPCLWST